MLVTMVWSVFSRFGNRNYNSLMLEGGKEPESQILLFIWKTDKAKSVWWDNNWQWILSKPMAESFDSWSEYLIVLLWM